MSMTTPGKCLCADVILVLMISALLALTPLGFSQDTSTVPNLRVSDVQLNAIIGDMTIRRSLNSELTTALGLTHSGETLPTTQTAYVDHSGFTQFFAKPDNCDGYIVGVVSAAYTQYYLLTTNLVLVASAMNTPKDGTVIVANNDAQPPLNQQWRFWGRVGGALAKDAAKRK